jgi:hypothetical protein
MNNIRDVIPFPRTPQNAAFWKVTAKLHIFT